MEEKIKQEPGTYRRWARAAQTVNRFLPPDHGVALGAGAGAVFNIIILPLVIPLALLAIEAAAGFVEDRCNHRADECEVSMEQSHAQVKDIGEALEAVQTSIQEFVDWWSDTQEKLDIIKQKVAYGNFSESPEVDAILSEWGDVKERYQEYAFRIKKLQTFYPKVK
ncbi:hypothetical protein VKT23_007871 [Stygiomarasmius scandens]|uniref:Uncharacterized protein n=1 Tax=Marasmiellus scandens TaxID=2682957 RepID=A0ABR1JJT6_9AGAR